MKKIFAVSFFVCLVFPQLAAQPLKRKILILGTYHMGGLTPDKNRVKEDNILSAQRQKEVRVIVNALTDFRPSQIMIEVTPARTPGYNKAFKFYKTADSLPKNMQWLLPSEIFQLAFQTAKITGLDSLNGVDWQLSEDTVSLIGKSNWQHTLTVASVKYEKGDYVTEQIEKLQTSLSAFTRDSIPLLPLKQIFYRLNDERRMNDAHYAWNLSFMEKNPGGVGAESAAVDMLRNLKIYQNIVAASRLSKGNLLVIIGANHARTLKNWLNCHPDFETVEVSSVF